MASIVSADSEPRPQPVAPGPGFAIGEAPGPVVVGGVALPPAHGQPRVLAFAHAWSLADEDPAAIRALRAQLRGLGAELLVVSPRGAWSVRPDDPIEPLAHTLGAGEPLAADVAAAAARYGVAPDHDAVFVIDGRGILRFAHRPAAPAALVGGKLADALAIAGE